MMKHTRQHQQQQSSENGITCAGCDDRINSSSASFRIDYCGHIFCVRCTSRLDYYESAATAMNACPVCTHLHPPAQQAPQSNHVFDMFRYPQQLSQEQQPHQQLAPQYPLADEDEGFHFQNITEEEEETLGASEQNPDTNSGMRSESAHLPPEDHFSIYTRPITAAMIAQKGSISTQSYHQQQQQQTQHTRHYQINETEISQSAVNFPSSRQGSSPQKQGPQAHQQYILNNQQQQPTNPSKKTSSQSFYYELEDEPTLSEKTQIPATRQQQPPPRQLSSNNSPSSSSHRSLASPHYYPKNQSNSNRFISQSSSAAKANNSPLQSSQQQQQQMQQNPLLTPLKCKEHDDFIQLYCAQDKTLLCVNCYYENAKKHEGHNIAPVKHSLDLIARENALFQLEAKEKLQAISSSLRICVTNRSLLSDNYTALCDNIHAEFSSITQILAQQEQRAIDTLTRIFEERITEYDQMLADLNYLNTCIHEYRDYSSGIPGNINSSSNNSNNGTPNTNEADSNFTLSLFSIYSMIRNTLKNIDFSFNTITKSQLYSLCDFNRPKSLILEQIPHLGEILNQLEIRGGAHATIKPHKQGGTLKQNQHNTAQLTYSSRRQTQGQATAPAIVPVLASANPKSERSNNGTLTPSSRMLNLPESSAKQTPRQISHQNSLQNFGGGSTTPTAEQSTLPLHQQGSPPSLRSSQHHGSSSKQINNTTNQKVLSSAAANHMSYAQTIVNRSTKFSNKKQQAEQFRDTEKQATPPHDQRRLQDYQKNQQTLSYYTVFEEKLNGVNPNAKHRLSKKTLQADGLRK